ncbi:MAG: glycosyltransferase [Pyrinomonadaceae bacterium]|nr:glycosyltransferase [Pyrinomonadaceae bacterium]
MNEKPRVAYFPDSYLEVNGVAMTSNRLTGFVRKKGYPFLCVHAAKKTGVEQDSNIIFVGLKRSPFSFKMDEDLRYDPFFQRHERLVRRELEKFRPDVIHITGLNDVSIMGALLAWKMDVALIGSWHTNLHEYAARRLRKLLRFLPSKQLNSFTDFLEQKIFEGAALYYKMPQIILAPNQELIDQLEKRTGRTAHLMIRGVDTELFSPEKRTVDDDITRFGFVGRLRAEKNVRMLADLEERLLKAGKTKIKFLIVGEGDERGWLEKNMKTAEFTGFLQGEQLSEAYANMDVFVFPSETDAYGNVPQEAMASGVPALVTDKGGPKFIVIDGETGFICKDQDEFAARCIQLIDDPERLSKMKDLSLEFARNRSWDSVFEDVYRAYAETKEFLDNKKKLRKEK